MNVLTSEADYTHLDIKAKQNGAAHQSCQEHQAPQPNLPPRLLGVKPTQSMRCRGCRELIPDVKETGSLRVHAHDSA